MATTPRRRKLTGAALDNAARAVLEAEDDPSAPGAIAEDELASVEDEGQRPAECRISRIDPDDGKPKFLMVAPPSMVNERWLSKKFGGGEYVTMTYGTRKDGTFGFLKGTRKTFNIDASIPFKGAGSAVQDGPVPRLREEGDDDTRQLFKNQLMEMMRDQSESRQQSAMFMMQIMKMMADASTANTQAMAAMVQAMKPTGSGLGEAVPLIVPVLTALLSRKDPTEIAAHLLALQKENAPGGLGNIETLLDLADRLNRRANGEDVSLVGVLKDTLPAAVDAIGKIATARAQHSPSAPVAAPQPQLPRPATAFVHAQSPEPDPAHPETAPVAPDAFTPLEPYIPQAVALAENDADPHGMAQTLLTLAPGRVKAMLREFLTRDDAAPYLMQRFPALAPYPTWVAEVVEELRNELLGEPADADDPPDPSLPIDPETPPA